MSDPAVEACGMSNRLVRAKDNIKQGDFCYAYRAGRRWWLSPEASGTAYERIARHEIKQNESVPFNHYKDTEALRLPSRDEAKT